ncbi:hypothetical protein AHiyo8_22670 [Arthrobacter sp. Hiyo8]|nr:hypothetical protein AHiyo8_22670 [Arthrobacter sp. Hiyo8]
MAQRLEQGKVATHLDLEEFIGDVRAAAYHAVERLGVLEVQEPGFRQWIDGYDLAAVVLAITQG